MSFKGVEHQKGWIIRWKILLSFFLVKIRKHYLLKVTQHSTFIRPVILAKVNVPLSWKLKDGKQFVDLP